MYQMITFTSRRKPSRTVRKGVVKQDIRFPTLLTCCFVLLRTHEYRCSSFCFNISELCENSGLSNVYF